MHQLHRASAALKPGVEQSSSVGQTCRLVDIGAIALDDFLGFVLEIKQSRHAGLHLERHLVLADAGIDFGVAVLGEVLLVQVL